MNIVVTGGEGQLANCIKEYISNKNNKHNYIFLSKKELDITDFEVVKEKLKHYKANIVINCAAYTNVDAANENITKACSINQYGVLYLVKATEEINAKLIHISTDFVFDGNSNVPYEPECKCVNPISIYGKSKLAGEEIAMKYKHTMVIRTSWLYSSYGKNFAKTMFKRILNEEETFVVDDQIGSPTYALDLACFIVGIIENIDNNSFLNKIIHYSNNGLCSWYDFAKAIEFILNKNTTNIIKPCTTQEYKNLIKKEIAERPIYSVLSKKSSEQINGYYNDFWLTSLEKCISKLKNEQKENI